MALSASYRTDAGMDPEDLIRVLAYNQVTPLLKPHEQWSSAKIQELWAKLANFPAVCIRIHASPGAAQVSATTTRKHLSCGDTSPYEVKVIGCQVVVWTKVHLSDIPPPPPLWHKWYPPTEWIDMAEARTVLGLSRARVHELVKQHNITHRVYTAAGARLFDRDQIMALRRRKGKWNTMRRRSNAARTFGMTALPPRMIG
jgi:hypothetical protein